VDALTYQHKTKKYLNFAKKFHVHDEESICRVGDKVIIRVCRPLSFHKHYYIRNIVWMGPRQNFYYKDLLEYEKRALLYNKNLRRNHQYSLNEFQPNERI
jgi:ribosomal protein S17